MKFTTSFITIVLCLAILVPSGFCQQDYQPKPTVLHSARAWLSHVVSEFMTVWQYVPSYAQLMERFPHLALFSSWHPQQTRSLSDSMHKIDRVDVEFPIVPFDYRIIDPQRDFLLEIAMGYPTPSFARSINIGPPGVHSSALVWHPKYLASCWSLITNEPQEPPQQVNAPTQDLTLILLLTLTAFSLLLVCFIMVTKRPSLTNKYEIFQMMQEQQTMASEDRRSHVLKLMEEERLRVMQERRAMAAEDQRAHRHREVDREIYKAELQAKALAAELQCVIPCATKDAPEGLFPKCRRSEPRHPIPTAARDAPCLARTKAKKATRSLPLVEVPCATRDLAELLPSASRKSKPSPPLLEVPCATRDLAELLPRAARRSQPSLRRVSPSIHDTPSPVHQTSEGSVPMQAPLPLVQPISDQSALEGEFELVENTSPLNQFHLFLDIDGTMVHCVHPRDINEHCGVTEFDMFGLRGYRRPGLEQFMKMCFATFKSVSIFTAGTSPYAHEIAKLVAPQGHKFKFVLSREHLSPHPLYPGMLTKDLVAMWKSPEFVEAGVTSENSFIIDDTPAACANNMRNAIIVRTFAATEEDHEKDKELTTLRTLFNSSTSGNARQLCQEALFHLFLLREGKTMKIRGPRQQSTIKRIGGACVSTLRSIYQVAKSSNNGLS